MFFSRWSFGLFIVVLCILSTINAYQHVRPHRRDRVIKRKCINDISSDRSSCIDTLGLYQPLIKRATTSTKKTTTSTKKTTSKKKTTTSTKKINTSKKKTTTSTKKTTTSTKKSSTSTKKATTSTKKTTTSKKKTTTSTKKTTTSKKKTTTSTKKTTTSTKKSSTSTKKATTSTKKTSTSTKKATTSTKHTTSSTKAVITTTKAHATTTTSKSLITTTATSSITSYTKLPTDTSMPYISSTFTTTNTHITTSKPTATSSDDITTSTSEMIHHHPTETGLPTTPATSSWFFDNWNKFVTATVGKGSVWDSIWKIPSKNGWLWIWENAENATNVLEEDPSGLTSDMTLSVFYPNNSRSPSKHPIGGVGFRAEPLNITCEVGTVDFEYQVYFPLDFDFVLGGKLPGLYGGLGECTGGVDAKDCFSIRTMWRPDGDGEIYAYLPEDVQRPDICTGLNHCNADFGYSLGRGGFRYERGRWNKIRQIIRVNTIGEQNGQILLYANDVEAINVDRLVIATNIHARVGGILFHTFFGGSNSSWNTPKGQMTYFKGFSLRTY